MDGMISQYRLLGHALEFASQNHRVISQNLANVNTPHYAARQLSFEQFLERVKQGKLEALNTDPPQYDVSFTEGLAMRADGNNVDLDAELGNLKRNEMIYQTLAQLVGAKLDIMRTAIKG